MIKFYFKLLILVIVFSSLCLLALFNNTDYVKEDYLIDQAGELISRLKYQEMLQSSASKDVYFLHQKMKNIQQSGNGSSDSMKSDTLPDFLVNKDLSVPSIFSFLPHLSLSEKSLTPAYKLSAGRTSVDVVMGIPTVKRVQQNYLLSTLQNLMDGIGNKSISKCLVVVFVAELDIDYVERVASVIKLRFPEHVQSGLIEVISPSPSFYPDMEKLRQTLGDPMERIKWRSKQTLDYAYLMMYAQSRGKYYVQMEDDVTAKKDYLDAMINFAAKQTVKYQDWLMLEFCRLGFIGKMFKTEDLPFFVQFFIMFFNDLPVDWVYPTAIDVKLCSKFQNEKKCKETKKKKIIQSKPSLFQHVGLHSSLKGKLQKLKDKAFGKTQLFFPHKNPEATVSTTIKQYKTYSLENAYKGQNYFWGLTAAANDEVLFKFKKPFSLAAYLFRSGNAEHQSDVFVQTTVEVLPVETLAFEKDPLKKTSDGYIVIGEFDSVGLAKSDVDPRIGHIKAIRLKVHVDTSSNWVILNEIYLKESE